LSLVSYLCFRSKECNRRIATSSGGNLNRYIYRLSISQGEGPNFHYFSNFGFRNTIHRVATYLYSACEQSTTRIQVQIYGLCASRSVLNGQVELVDTTVSSEIGQCTWENGWLIKDRYAVGCVAAAKGKRGVTSLDIGIVPCSPWVRFVRANFSPFDRQP